jgi:hypothetical protein
VIRDAIRWFVLCTVAAIGAVVALTPFSEASEDRSELVAIARSVTLSRIQTPVTLATKRQSDCDSLFSQRPNARYTLVLRGVHSETEPGVAYRLVLNLPKNAKALRNDAGYVGDLNFFGRSPTPRGSPDVSYEITDALLRLKERGRAQCPVSLTFATDLAPEQGSNPGVSSLEIWRHERLAPIAGKP